MRNLVYVPLEVGKEPSLTTSVRSSLRWKFLWHPQAAQVREAPPLLSSPDGMNSRQPSTAYPPTLAAWFFWHSPYLTLVTVKDEFEEHRELSSFFITTWRFFMSIDSFLVIVISEFRCKIKQSKQKEREKFFLFFLSPFPLWERERERKNQRMWACWVARIFVHENPNPRGHTYTPSKPWFIFPFKIYFKSFTQGYYLQRQIPSN